jgi:hypothetical protein
LGFCNWENRRWAWFISPESERAQKAKTRLTGKVWVMRAVFVMWAWICFNWSIEVHDSIAKRIGWVIMVLVGEFHLVGFVVVVDENCFRDWKVREEIKVAVATLLEEDNNWFIWNDEWTFCSLPEMWTFKVWRLILILIFNYSRENLFAF